MVSSITSLNEMLNRAFALAYFIHGDKRIALRITTDAMAKLEVATSAQQKRLYYRPTGRFSRDHQGYAKRSKVSFSDLHLLQRLVYIESERHEQQKEQAADSSSINEEDMIIHFIKHLVKITLRRNSFYVTLGLSRLLYNYSTSEAMEIYNVVAQDPERVKDDYYYRSRKRLLIGEMKERFGSLIRIRRGARGEERFQALDRPERYLGLVKQCLLFFTPWQTPCLVPPRFDPTLESIIPFLSQDSIEEDKVEINRIHAILEPDCFQRLIEGLGFDAPDARLEVPHFFISQESNDGPRTGRHDPLRLDEQELLAVRGELSELTARRKRAAAGLLRVVVDGVERACLNLSHRDQMRFPIEPSAELLEVRGQDAGGEILLASHLFRRNPRGDGFIDDKLPILLETGQKLLITVTPSEQGTAEWTGASVFVSCRQSSPIRAIAHHARRLGARASERFGADGGDYPGALIPILASLLLLICMAGIAAHLLGGRSLYYQPVVNSSEQADIIFPIDAPPTSINDVGSSNAAESETERPRVAPAREQTAQIASQQGSRQRRGGSALRGRTGKTIASPVESENNLFDGSAQEIELTRDLSTGLRPAPSLAEVRKIYIEVTSSEDMTLEANLRKDLTQAPGFSRRFVLAEQRDDADALLKISVTRPVNREGEVKAPPAMRANGSEREVKETRPTPISVTARLINADGRVIWPVGANGSRKRYQGAAAEVSLEIIKDLLEDAEGQKRSDR